MADQVYRWKPRTSIDSDPQVVGEYLEALRVKHNGFLTPQIIVSDAQKKKSPLRGCFEWDDETAAVRYREDEARYLLRMLVLVVEGQAEESKKTIRAFVSVSVENQQPYTSIGYVMGQKELREQVLRRAWKELESWRRRYEEYEEFAQTVLAIEARNRGEDKHHQGKKFEEPKERRCQECGDIFLAERVGEINCEECTRQTAAA